jgi:peptidoglycan/xylan/chitin deacetylase (PgdA/CDA1 family)
LLPRGLSALTFDDGFADLYHHAWPSLRRRGLAATVFLVAETLSDTGREVDWVDDPPSFRLTTLDREQVLEMQEAGITFGSHTYSHPDLTAVTDEECERELRASKQLLEALVGREVPFLAYPRGRHNARVRRAAERVGYVWAFSLPQGRESVGRYATPRVGVYGGNSLLTLRVKSTRFYQHTRVGRSKVADRV